jgi:hypothetical protein
MATGSMLTNVGREQNWHFRIKMREYLVGKINEVETKNEEKNFREMYCWDVYKISLWKRKMFF